MSFFLCAGEEDEEELVESLVIVEEPEEYAQYGVSMSIEGLLFVRNHGSKWNEQWARTEIRNGLNTLTLYTNDTETRKLTDSIDLSHVLKLERAKKEIDQYENEDDLQEEVHDVFILHTQHGQEYDFKVVNPPYCSSIKPHTFKGIGNSGNHTTNKDKRGTYKGDPTAEEWLLALDRFRFYGSFGKPEPHTVVDHNSQVVAVKKEHIEGIHKQRVKAGMGFSMPQPGQTVSVSWTGYGKGGNTDIEFDSSTHFIFTIGCSRLFPGFDESVCSMREGEIAAFHLPPDYGYGEEGNASLGILPNTELKLMLELIHIEELQMDA